MYTEAGRQVTTGSQKERRVTKGHAAPWLVRATRVPAFCGLQPYCKGARRHLLWQPHGKAEVRDQDALLRRSDAAAYAAKRAGRNRVEWY